MSATAPNDSSTKAADSTTSTASALASPSAASASSAPADGTSSAHARDSASTSRPGALSRDRGISFFRATWVLIRKDLLLEWRTRARINALIFFALATLMLFAFALDANRLVMQAAAGGLLWLALFFSSVLSLGESFRVEGENAALDGVRLIPTSARAIFISKALGNTLLLYALGWLLLPVMAALYNIHVSMGLGLYALTLGLGCLSITAPGVVFSAIANNARARDVLLPLLLFPLLIPALLGSVKATGLVFGGDPMEQLDSWLKLVASFDVIYWSLGFLLFPKVIED